MNANIVRTFTAPVGIPKLHPSNSSSNVQYAASNDPHRSAPLQSSRSSDNTQSTSISTQSNTHTSSSGVSNVGPVTASDNVMNRVANKDTSLFQVCVALRARLSGVPGFESQVLQVEDELEEGVDPVMLLWSVFRRGYPLMTIYNALRPEEPLEVDENKVSLARRAQAASYKFLQACINVLGFPPAECFMISDLQAPVGEINMSGFVKVVRVVHRVVDLLVQKGVLIPLDGSEPSQAGLPGAKRTHRQHIVDELVRTERTYVQHLELLQTFSKHVKQTNVITGDAVHDIFLNLDDLLEFQRRFLVRVEQTNAQPEDVQNWGRLFWSFAPPMDSRQETKKDFRVYEPFIGNQKRCEEVTMREFEKLRGAGGPVELRQMVESPTNLTSFLLKPFQRLSKYPLLLKDLRDKGGLDDERRADLTQALDAVTAILHRTNATLDKEERTEAVRELKSQVEDWKHHRVEAFGDLLLYGNHIVVKGDPTKESSERERFVQYRMYLFEKILLCCKEIDMNKPKNKMKPAPPPSKRGKPRLQLKGRIFMQNVTDVQFLSNLGSYTCQIFWRGDDTIEHFIIKFSTEEMMRKWFNNIEAERRKCSEQMMANFPNTSRTEFHYLTSQPAPENPYRDDDAGEDEDPATPSVGYAESANFSASRNGSNTSFSTTGDTTPALNPSGARGRKASLGLGTMPGLTLRTQPSIGSAMSPNDRGGNSYFSPGGESPVSSRGSTSSNMLPFQRQAPPQNGWHPEEQNSRFTAPAMGRSSLARDAQGNYFGEQRGTSTSQAHAPHFSSLAQNRLRSASNPDVHNLTKDRRTPVNAPPVPSVPSHLTQGVNRSQNNSPMTAGSFRGASGVQQPQSNGDHNSYGYGDGTIDSWDSYTQQQGITPLPLQPGERGMMSPPLGSAVTRDGDSVQPSQLKVKVKVPSEGSAMTLVVGFNITYEKLKDRIEAKLQRNTNVSLASGAVKLKYMDDDEYISIQTDEDVQTAFETWREQQGNEIMGQLGEIELFCTR